MVTLTVFSNHRKKKKERKQKGFKVQIRNPNMNNEVAMVIDEIDY